MVRRSVMVLINDDENRIDDFQALGLGSEPVTANGP